MASADPWPQFRGPNASGVSLEKHSLPVAIAPDKNVLWSRTIPPGVSSPVIFGQRMYLTAERENKQLVTMAINTVDGQTVWEHLAPIHQLEKTDRKPQGRLATPSAATDGQRIVVFFGSSGLLCYDTAGTLIWHRKLGPFEDRRGATSSPIIADGKVILVEDHETGSFLAAFDLQTGKTVWHADRMLFNRSYNTPVVWTQGDQQFVVVAGSGLLTAYNLQTGKPSFFVQGTSGVANPTAVIGANDTLFVSSANPGPKREFQPEFAELVSARDKNKDGQLKADELPTGLFQSLWQSLDTEQDGLLSAAEYTSIQQLMGTCTNGMMAVKPGGKGLDRTETNLLWHEKKSIPRTSSPVYYQGRLYLVNDGGLLACLDAETGRQLKTVRGPARGKYFGSAVLGDDKIYCANDRGELTVISADPDLKVLSFAQFEEPIYPSPAISNGRLYLRTESRLFCFGEVK
ncbi:MAG: PQQ-binding-like beta-propeller repeat protein [Pirellulaceae bacterium]